MKNTSEIAANMYRKMGTKQCAVICMSHSCLIPLGECPSLLDMWTPEVIADWEDQRQMDHDQFLSTVSA